MMGMEQLGLSFCEMQSNSWLLDSFTKDGFMSQCTVDGLRKRALEVCPSDDVLKIVFMGQHMWNWKMLCRFSLKLVRTNALK